MAEETGLNAPRRLKYGQRKASFSDTLNKLKTNSFTRRRTAPDLLSPKSTLSSSSSYTKIEPKQEQSQPQPRRSTPSRIPRSSSFFNSLNTFVPRGTTSHNNKESGNTKPNPVKQPRKITHRFSQPPSYFNSFPSQQDLTEPLIPKPKSNTQITQRALMQPFSNPPLPRRSTMGNLTQKPPTQTPGFMRPTSSSAARHNIGRAVSKSHALNKTMTTMTPNLPRSRRSEQFPPPTNFSLPSALRLPREPVQESTTPITSPKVSLERSERPKLDINSNLTFDELLRSITPEGEEAENVSGEITEVGETSDEKMTPEPIFAPSPHQITTAQPHGYWAGRMTALSDRFRSEALESPSSSTHDSDMHDDKSRLRRVFIHLRSLCTTKEAIESLEAFHRTWAMREQGKEGGIVAAHEIFGDGSSGVKKVKEKRGVFEILTGRKK